MDAVTSTLHALWDWGRHEAVLATQIAEQLPLLGGTLKYQVLGLGPQIADHVLAELQAQLLAADLAQSVLDALRNPPPGVPSAVADLMTGVADGVTAALGADLDADAVAAVVEAVAEATQRNMSGLGAIGDAATDLIAEVVPDILSSLIKKQITGGDPEALDNTITQVCA